MGNPYQPRFNMLHPPVSMINKGPPSVIARAGPVYASKALSAKMLLILHDYYCPNKLLRMIRLQKWRP